MEMVKRLGNGIGKSSRWVILAEAKALGVKMMASTMLKSWDGTTAVIRTEDGEIRAEFDDLVYAVGVRPVRPGFLDDLDIPMVVIGDSNTPKNLGAAIETAREGVNRLLKNAG